MMQTKTENKSYIVYMHIAPNKKKYIGITGQTTQERWRVNGHGYKSQSLFYRAIQKYGWHNFQHIIIAENLTKEKACKIEQELIQKYKTTDSEFGYNLSIGGSVGPLGVKRSEETLLKLRTSHLGQQGWNKGNHLSDETKQKLRIFNLGKKMSNETKEKISQKNKNRKPTKWATQRAIEVCSKPVKSLINGQVYTSATEAAKKSHVPLNTITRHCRNEVKNPKWEYC